MILDASNYGVDEYGFVISSDWFPILDEEDEEIVNPETYGKSFALYLKDAFENRGYKCPFIVCEDYGWWLEIGGFDFVTAIVLCRIEPDEPKFMGGIVPDGDKAWSWRKFRLMKTKTVRDKIAKDLYDIFESDTEIQILEYPWIKS